MLVTFRALGTVGRLGNQLFQIASTVGVARSNGCVALFPPWEYARYFNGQVPQADALPSLPTYLEQSFSFQKIAVTQSTNLLGFFQSERYFKHCEAEIRRLFAPHPRLVAQMRAKFGSLLAKKTCSVHVRRTDYVEHPHFIDLAATGYYEEAMSRFDSDTVFVVFSDDIQWCKERFRGERFVFVEKLTTVADLFLMSACRGHIIANSSFSWWGAWLDPRPGKRVIAPAHWFAGDHADPQVPFQLGVQCHGYRDTRDLIPEGWIRL